LERRPRSKGSIRFLPDGSHYQFGLITYFGEKYQIHERNHQQGGHNEKDFDCYRIFMPDQSRQITKICDWILALFPFHLVESGIDLTLEFSAGRF
jgi:hypothetical protein